MKKMLIAISVILAACSSDVIESGTDPRHGPVQKLETPETHLNEGAKWKADLTTKKNVGLMLKVMTEHRYLALSESKNLSVALQARVDLLIKECRMQGRDHDALHKWLEEVLDKMKDLEEGSGYKKSVETLRGEIERFYLLFD